MDRQRVNEDSLDTMWSFLQMGNQKPNVPLLIEDCEKLKKLLTQKTAGQRKDKPKDIPITETDSLINEIVIETMALYLSGELERDISKPIRYHQNNSTYSKSPLLHGAKVFEGTCPHCGNSILYASERGTVEGYEWRCDCGQKIKWTNQKEK